MIGLAYTIDLAYARSGAVLGFLAAADAPKALCVPPDAIPYTEETSNKSTRGLCDGQKKARNGNRARGD